MLPLQDELEREGIWDFDRLSRPYITQEILQVIIFLRRFYSFMNYCLYLENA